MDELQELRCTTKWRSFHTKKWKRVAAIAPHYEVAVLTTHNRRAAKMSVSREAPALGACPGSMFVLPPSLILGACFLALGAARPFRITIRLGFEALPTEPQLAFVFFSLLRSCPGLAATTAWRVNALLADIFTNIGLQPSLFTHCLFHLLLVADRKRNWFRTWCFAFVAIWEATLLA